ncbi:MAG: zinc ribbon domain-containing protein [Clostridiales bacterium]|nr:zinc ribbon domain-containing protein [Clostridiales bacterium]
MSFLNQLGKIVPKSGPQTASQQGYSAYLDGLTQSKNGAKQEISALFLELGKAYYESHADDHETEFETQLAAIRDGYAKIAQCEQEAEEIAAHKRCPSCGAQLAEGSLFCNICGTKLPEVSDGAEQEEQQNLCPRCQAEIQPGDVFCTACGANLRDDISKQEHDS